MAVSIQHPLAFDSPYRSYLSPTYPLSLWATRHDLRPVLASYYINIEFPRAKAESGHGIGAAFTPWLRVDQYAQLGLLAIEECPPGLSVSPSSDLVSWGVEKLAAGRYLYAHVNEKYVPCTARYGKHDFCHPCLISGCDTGSKTFTIATYLANGKYGPGELSFELFLKSMRMRGRKQNDNPHHEARLAALSLRENSDFRFDRGVAAEHLEQYIASLPCTRPELDGRFGEISVSERAEARLKSRFFYGSETLKGYELYLRLLIERGEPIFLRDTRMLVEHKKIMSLNLSYWWKEADPQQAAEVVLRYGKVVDWANMLHLNCISYNKSLFRKSDSLVRYVRETLGMAELEQAILLKTQDEIFRR